MFTGIIQAIGSVVSSSSASGGRRLAVSAPGVFSGVRVGDSVAVNGVCLTAVAVSASAAEFDAVEETVSRTTLGSWRPGDKVNLEPSLRAGDQMGGHMVLGHVDCRGKVSSVARSGAGYAFEFEIPPDALAEIVVKGSVAVDGVSLTVASLSGSTFSVAVIPHTSSATTLGSLKKGDAVNIETDIIGKYIKKFLGAANGPKGMDEEFLHKHGF